MIQTPLDAITPVITTPDSPPRPSSSTDDVGEPFQTHLSRNERSDETEPIDDSPAGPEQLSNRSDSEQPSDNERDGDEQAPTAEAAASTTESARDLAAEIIDEYAPELRLTTEDEEQAESGTPISDTPTIVVETTSEPVASVSTEALSPGLAEEVGASVAAVDQQAEEASSSLAQQSSDGDTPERPVPRDIRVSVEADDDGTEVRPHQQAVEVDDSPENSDERTPDRRQPATQQQATSKVTTVEAPEPTVDTELAEARDRRPNKSSVDLARPSLNNADAPPTEGALRDDGVRGAGTARFADQLFAKASARTEGEQGLASADQARLIDRVGRAVESAAVRGSTQIRLRLSPPELGSLRLQLEVQEGTVAARLEAETPTARATLLDNVSVLRERLAEQGIRLEQFDVDLLGRHSADTPQQRGDDQAQRENRDSPGEAPLGDGQGGTADGVSTSGVDGELNVVV